MHFNTYRFNTKTKGNKILCSAFAARAHPTLNQKPDTEFGIKSSV